jgi:hypothetical protein
MAVCGELVTIEQTAKRTPATARSVYAQRSGGVRSPWPVTAVAESAARWVLLTDGRAHLPASDRPGVFSWRAVVIPCPGECSSMSACPATTCARRASSVYLLPESVFSRTPAGRRLSEAPDSTPGGQSAPELVSPRARRQVLRTPIVTVLEGI